MQSALENPLFRLDGRTAVVTGGAGLLGVQHAIALASVGARIVVTDVNPAATEAAAKDLAGRFGADKILARRLDVTDPASVADLVREMEVLGGVDILVNNAAIDPKVTADDNSLEMSRLEHFALQQWSIELSVGLTGAFLCSQAFGAAMAQRGRGVILNIASDLSVIAPDQRLYRKDGLPEDRQPVKPVTYPVIKAGLIGLTRYLAGYWADKGVRVNALSPGGVYVSQPDAFVKRLTNLIPMGRMANRDEYHGAIQFLCSDASAYLTGQNIVMDGGRSIL